MEQISAFLIPFIGLREGIHSFNFNISNQFFEGFEFFDFKKADVKVDLIFTRVSAFLKG